MSGTLTETGALNGNFMDCVAVSCVLHNYSAGFAKALGFRMIKNWAGFKSPLQRKVEYYGYGHNSFWDPFSRAKNIIN